MNPFTVRLAILITELLVFLMVTALMTYFISFASAPEFPAGATPPAEFPVLVYDGDRARPEPKQYRVARWNEWRELAERQPAASLLLPERTRVLQIGENVATFNVTEDIKTRQTVELLWRTGDEERRTRYTTDGRSVEPREFRTITTKTVILGGMAGCAAGLLIGQLLRRRIAQRPA